MKNILKCLTVRNLIIMMIIIMLIIAQVKLDLLIPGYIARITAYLQSENNNMSELIKLGLLMLLFAFLSLIVSVLYVILNSRVGSDYSSSLRKALFYKVQDMSIEEEHKFTVSSLITRTTNDIRHIELFFLSCIQMLIHAPILGGGALVKILALDYHWSIVTGIAASILIIVMVIVLSLTMKRFRRVQLLTDDLNTVTRESIIGMQTLRAYNAEWYHEKRFNTINDELTNTNIFNRVVLALLNPFLMFLMNVVTLSIYCIGMMLIGNAAPDEKVELFSNMIAFSSYALQLGTAFMMLFAAFLDIPQAMVSIKRISEVLDSEDMLKNGDFKGIEVDGAETELDFYNVSFKYSNGNDNVLDNISFKAKKGETVAVVGSTGCGKTTLVNLIPRFYDATSGAIKLNGIDLKKYDQKALRDKIGFIPQKTYLLSGTVASNVAYSSDINDIDDVRVYEAVKIANLDTYINDLDDGIYGSIAKNGANLSGGQRQRLSIARAIYKNPEIIVFDDSFSALDYKTDLSVRKALKEKYRNAIKIIVAQRVNTVKDADKIIVLEKGRMAGIGTHNELLENCEVYQQIVASQLSKEEISE